MIASHPTIPPTALLCPKCGSPDTPPKHWSDDREKQRELAEAFPNARYCVDCKTEFGWP